MSRDRSIEEIKAEIASLDSKISSQELLVLCDSDEPFVDDLTQWGRVSLWFNLRVTWPAEEAWWKVQEVFSDARGWLTNREFYYEVKEMKAQVRAEVASETPQQRAAQLQLYRWRREALELERLFGPGDPEFTKQKRADAIQRIKEKLASREAEEEAS